ncbi:hypothetical protein NUU61_009310 [Penicillium alfredii]|uniref:Uncharacterized protein n=1 Tax=Penicillium alfredii TaxID=1506179 RepID=A0A9W9EN50_9EURO|nr:uncharacterized protein NUU61_009310 [Penicillium alfredii]KAJ5084731.1 hypothetical protein NUU61_009310 [Penicillium alfredii]
MKPAALDLGRPRFLEFNLTVVVKSKPSPLDFQFAADTLASQWPALALRMNPLKNKFIEPKMPEDLSDIWQGRELDRNLGDIIDVPLQGDSPRIFDSEALQKSVHFAFGFVESIKQRVLTIRTVFLRDSCVIGFRFLHPLCDARGAHRIVQAYLTLLRGDRLTHTIHSRPSLMLKPEVLKKCVAMTTPREVATSHHEVSQRTWPGFLQGFGKQLVRNICHRSSRRVSKTLLVPADQMQRWIRDAEDKGIKVTEHDLLVAFIYQASLDPTIEQAFGLSLNIAAQLQPDAEFFNPWFTVPITDYINPTSHIGLTPSLLELAITIRRTLNEAREPECIAQIIDQHRSLNDMPTAPKLQGSRAAQTLVSSWSEIPLYDLDIQGENPLFVHGSVDYCGALGETGWKLDDQVVTWKAKSFGDSDGGYWIHANLPDAVWRRMVQNLG